MKKQVKSPVEELIKFNKIGNPLFIHRKIVPDKDGDGKPRKRTPRECGINKDTFCMRLTLPEIKRIVKWYSKKDE